MHHSRRKSGLGSATTSMTDVRKATSHHHDSRNSKSKSGGQRSSRVLGSPSNSSAKLGKNPRDREREWEEESYWDEERESFPQFCMTCEKQFFSHDGRVPYCSEACRIIDQNSSSGGSNASADYYGTGLHAPINTYSIYAAEHPEPRDIVPRASPSRPTSTHFASPPSPPELPHTYHHSSAINALRNLSLTARPPSPQSPSMPGGVWPFNSTATTSPESSYTRNNSGFFSSTYDTGYGYQVYPTDRPLPSRRGPGYSRPKSIELVTPMIGR